MRGVASPQAQSASSRAERLQFSTPALTASLSAPI
jgi:hypothetical protein